MAGTQSAGFDLVMQFSEEPLRDLFGIAFDTSELLCTILDATLNQIPGVDIPCTGFAISVSLDRPTDVGLTASQTNAVDIQLSQTLGLIDWRIRIVAGVDVDRSAATFDVARLDFAGHLYHVEAHFGLLPISAATLRDYLRDTVKAIPLLPVLVDRGTTNDMQIKRLDAKVIDDTASGENALCYCLTFGTGTPGDLANLTQSLVGAGQTGTLMVGFGWILRQMEPVIESTLGIPADAFVGGHLTRDVVIDQEEDVSLTRFDFELVDGFIRVTARIAKSGFCYSASGQVGGQFRIEVVDGTLHVDADISDPDIDLDIPWYCWIGAIFLGGLIGGIIGAVVVPLVLYLVTSTVEGILDRISDTIVNALNVLNPEVSLPAVGFDLVFQNAFIDDVGIGCRVRMIDNAPVRSEGTVRLRRGQAFDFDSGRVATGRFEGADVEWVGEHDARTLAVVCSAQIADTRSKRWDEVFRYETYGLDYVRGRALPVHELGFLQDLGIPWLDLELFVPTLAVYAIRSNERRFAVFQVIEVESDAVRLRYRTYGLRDPALQIRGGFKCGPDLSRIPIVDAKAIPANVVFEPPTPRVDVGAVLAKVPGLAARRPDTDCPEPRSKKPSPLGEPVPPTLAHLAELRAIERATGVPHAIPVSTLATSSSLATKATISAAEAHALVANRRPTLTQSLGRWTADVPIRTHPQGRFDVLVDGHGAPRAVLWWIDGVLLDPAAASTVIDGVTFEHSQAGTTLLVRLDLDRPLRFELTVGIDDANGRRFTTSTCVDYRSTCLHKVRAIPHWTRFKGLVAIPPA